MDSDALETFLAIHRSGGFSSAAEVLHRSQPAISRRIALLEAEIGAPLFERAAGGVVLSEAGRVLLPHAERVLAALKDTADALQGLRAGDSGQVTLAAVGTLAGTDLTTVLKRFAARCPGVGLILRTATSVEVSELVRRGEAAIGLRYFDDPAPDLVCRQLKPEALVVACARTHRLANKPVRALTALRGEAWLAFPKDRREPSAETIFAQFHARGVADIPWTPIDSLTAQKRLIEAGFGIALLPQSAIAEERAKKTLAVIRVGDLAIANPVSAVTRKDGYLSPASRTLLDTLSAEFAAGAA